MNFIKSLQAKNARLKEEIGAKDHQINEFICFLHSAKFTGMEINGERKDWISTSDVIHRLIEIRDLRPEEVS